MESQGASWPQRKLLFFQISIPFFHTQLSQRDSVIPGCILKIPTGLARKTRQPRASPSARLSRSGSTLLVVHLPSVAAVLRHQLQVLDADGLVLQLRHGVVDALLPGRDVVLLARGRGRQLVPGTQRPPAQPRPPAAPRAPLPALTSSC